MMMQAEQNRLFPDSAGTVVRRFSVGNSLDTLVGPIVIIIAHVFVQDILQLRFCKNDEPVETFAADGTDEPFGISIHVGRIRGCGYVMNTVLFVREPAQFSRVVMNKKGIGILFLEHLKLLFQKSDGWILSEIEMDDFSGFEFEDKEDVEPFEAEEIDSEEVAGEQRVPVGLEEGFPGTDGEDKPPYWRQITANKKSSFRDRFLSQESDLQKEREGIFFS